MIMHLLKYKVKNDHLLNINQGDKFLYKEFNSIIDIADFLFQYSANISEYKIYECNLCKPNQKDKSVNISTEHAFINLS